jgi:hypothetical protein
MVLISLKVVGDVISPSIFSVPAHLRFFQG